MSTTTTTTTTTTTASRALLYVCIFVYLHLGMSNRQQILNHLGRRQSTLVLDTSSQHDWRRVLEQVRHPMWMVSAC